MLHQLSEVKSLWIDQIRETADRLNLFTFSLNIVAQSADELKDIATRPHNFEHAFLNGHLDRWDADELTLLVDDQTDIQSLELVPGGRWLVAISVVKEEEEAWGSSEIQVWDLAGVSNRSMDPITRFRLPSDQTGDIWPTKLNIQPEGQNVLIFAFSNAVDSDAPLYVPPRPLDGASELC